MKDLDSFHKDRVRGAIKRLRKGGFSLSELFLSEEVVKALSKQKLFLSSYKHEDLLAMLPFSDAVLVAVCPLCVSETKFEKFSRLVERGAFIPVLIAPYSMYPEKVVDLVANHDHISRYEFYSYRMLALETFADRGICKHCVDRSIQSSIDFVQGHRDFKKFKAAIEGIKYDLSPFLAPDYKLLESVFTACSRKSLRQLDQVENISHGVNAVRTAQALETPILLRIDEMEQLPKGIVREQDESASIQAEIERYAVDGLGLRIPTEIEPEEYLDLLDDVRPAISGIMQHVVGEQEGGPSSVTMIDVQKEVIRINSEIERIKNLRRTIVLDACVGFYRDHPKLVTTSLIMSALGLSGSMWGCAAALGIQTVRGAAQAVRGKQKTPEIERLKRTITRELRPMVDSLIAAYVGTELATVSVLSLRKILDDHKSMKPAIRRLAKAAG